MTNRFLISVAAAALIAGSGFANAQGTGGGAAGGGAAGGGSTMQQGGAPSERGAPSAAPMNRDSGPSESQKGAQTDRMDGGKAKSAQDTDRAKGGKDMKAEGREGKDSKSGTVGQSPADKSGTTTQGREDRMGQSKDKSAPASAQQGQDRTNAQGGAQTQGGTAQTQGGSQTTTTGQAGAGAKLSTEQQTKISTVIKQQNVAPVTNVNFSVSIGTRVPRDVHFHVLPQEVVTIYPQWRGYKFIRVREEIVIIDPNTFEIVEIIRV
jgi:hypothetical protein